MASIFNRVVNLFVLTVAIAMVISLMAANASAAWTPPEGTIKFKLTDAANLYTNGDIPAPRSELFPDGLDDAFFENDYEALLNSQLAGTRDFTAFEITSYRVDAGPLQSLPEDTSLTGIATFLEIKMLEATAPMIGNRSITLALGDDESRPHQLAGEFDPVDNRFEDPISGNATLGRFFLFDNSDAEAGQFDQTNSVPNDGIGGTPSDVLFSSGLGTVDCGGFECDMLDNFTGGTLVATGSFISSAESGGTPYIVNQLTASADEGISFTGIVFDTNLMMDGGVWFENEVLDYATFQINQFGFDDSGFDPLEGDQVVFDGGWQISSEDPITFEAHRPIPEPVTSGLTLLALGSLSGYLRRRRMA